MSRICEESVSKSSVELQRVHGRSLSRLSIKLRWHQLIGAAWRIFNHYKSLSSINKKKLVLYRIKRQGQQRNSFTENAILVLLLPKVSPTWNTIKNTDCISTLNSQADFLRKNESALLSPDEATREFQHCESMAHDSMAEEQ